MVAATMATVSSGGGSGNGGVVVVTGARHHSSSLSVVRRPSSLSWQGGARSGCECGGCGCARACVYVCDLRLLAGWPPPPLCHLPSYTATTSARSSRERQRRRRQTPAAEAGWYGTIVCTMGYVPYLGTYPSVLRPPPAAPGPFPAATPAIPLLSPQ
ncbi:uncharacterized protein K452DRAFT_136737 [Aplosporella prunicola CBS 121167]|uniref:Uncharacterized protein n=1 Tax=Aplosporella prunicola CBS 121167 TaxID=1176127 RepID=A0A6A6BM77_9PEZI|nr:uncharacterized protein K452DRAFT_136737 [Aplosporella prunicola CBS 121167]KAF2145240.1 hypothetical protein K452DRAFT_136737 [Aplosporella prunicola CBS 121167]